MTLRTLIQRFVSAVAGTWMLSACMTAPTTDVTKAPLRASTDLVEAPLRASSDLTDGTSQATTDLTEPTKNFTSSTSPKSWFSSDGTLKAEHRIRAFSVFAFQNLKQDIAQGSGEYVASLATLVGVPLEQHAEFFRFAQGHYGFIYAEDIRPAESLSRLIETLSTPASGLAVTTRLEK